MKHTINRRTLARSLMALFAPSKKVNAHERYGDVYYGNIYFTKQMFSGIECVANLLRKSKKQVANELMERGIRRYMGDKIKEYNKRVIAARELNEKVQVTHFILLLRRFAKERGYDISKFI